MGVMDAVVALLNEVDWSGRDLVVRFCLSPPKGMTLRTHLEKGLPLFLNEMREFARSEGHDLDSLVVLASPLAQSYLDVIWGDEGLDTWRGMEVIYDSRIEDAKLALVTSGGEAVAYMRMVYEKERDDVYEAKCVECGELAPNWVNEVLPLGSDAPARRDPVCFRHVRREIV